LFWSACVLERLCSAGVPEHRRSRTQALQNTQNTEHRLSRTQALQNTGTPEHRRSRTKALQNKGSPEHRHSRTQALQNTGTPEHRHSRRLAHKLGITVGTNYSPNLVDLFLYCIMLCVSMVLFKHKNRKQLVPRYLY
jgi:hypothetical protein